MKTIFNVFVLLLLSFSFNACDEAEDALDQDFSVNIDETIPVHVDQTGLAKTANAVIAPHAFQGSAVLSIDTDDTHGYLNKIKSVEVKSLTYKIIQFNGDPTGTIEGQLFVNNALLATNNITVKTESDKGTVFEVSNPEELTKIANALKSGYKVNASYQGTALCDNDEMNFRVQIMMRVRVTANPL